MAWFAQQRTPQTAIAELEKRVDELALLEEKAVAGERSAREQARREQAAGHADGARRCLAHALQCRNAAREFAAMRFTAEDQLLALQTAAVQSDVQTALQHSNDVLARINARVTADDVVRIVEAMRDNQTAVAELRGELGQTIVEADDELSDLEAALGDAADITTEELAELEAL